MKALVAFANLVCRGLALLGAAAVVLMMLHISADVLTRNLFRWSIPATADVVARYYMVTLAFLPLALLELRGGMISVELTDFLLPGWALRLSDVVMALLGAAIYALLAWVTWRSGMQNFRSGTFVELVNLKLLVWHSYFLPSLGFALAALASLIKAADRLRPGSVELAR